MKKIESVKIAHIADIHVRPHKYLDEMKFTFVNLLASLKVKKVELVTICGDFFHSKLTVSSEYFALAHWFLKELASSHNVIIIPGNHDSALTNQGRLDAITPIVDAVNASHLDYQLYYSKKSESWKYLTSSLYQHHQGQFLNFHHFSIYDDKTKWPKKEDLDKSKINIALYHGAINKCIVDNGWTSRGNRDDISIFDGFDFALLGDIHKFQFLNDEKTVAYPGSLRQNSFGEDIDKGYLLWDIRSDGSFDVERVILDQKRYFLTLWLNEASEIESLGDLPKDSRIRVRSTKALDLNDEILIKEELIRKFEPHTEIVFIPPDENFDSNQSIKVGNLDIIHENIRDLETQRGLIEEFLKKKGVTKEEMDEVFALDKKYHSSVDTDVLRNVLFQPTKLKWDNFFSYGKGNSINFDSLGNGLIGVFGNTGVGKSSIFDVLFFTLFNSIYKEGANKNGDYVNRKCKRADASLEILLNGGKFVIERGIKKVYIEGKDEPKVENSVDFYKLPKSDVNSLNGETGPDTNKFIRDTFGSKEDAEMLSHCSQFGLMSFIDAKGTKRKEIFSKFFDLGVFDFKFDLASKDHKEIKIKLKDCNKTELIKQVSVLEESVASTTEVLKDLAKDKEIIEKEKSALQEERAELKSKLVKVPDSINQNYDEDDYSRLKNETKRLEEALNSPVYDIYRNVTEARVAELEKVSAEADKARIKLPIFEKQSLLIEKIPGVAACKTCCLSKDAFEARDEKVKMEIVLSSTRPDVEFYAGYKQFKRVQDDFACAHAKFEKLEKEKVEFEKWKENITNNALIHEKISKLDRQISWQIDTRESILKSERNFVEKLTESKVRLEIVNEKLKVESGLVEKDKIYSLYLDAMGKNGISYWIVSKKLNLVTKLTNQILAQAVSSKFVIEDNEEEKSLKAYIVDEKGKRPIELSSGGEKTLVAIALRAALWKICLLPKMPILILDESLVFLDAEKYDSAIKLLKYLLQEYFDKIFIITHNEELKRVVDNSLYIQSNKGGSFIEVK